MCTLHTLIKIALHAFKTIQLLIRIYLDALDISVEAKKARHQVVKLAH